MDFLNNISKHPFISKYGPTLALIVTVTCLLALITLTGLDMKAQAKVKAENYNGDPKPKKKITNAPKTTLNLTLKGVLSASDTAVARAIIVSSKSKKAKLYSVGDEIKGSGASIEEIRQFEVILNRNGAIESLPLKKKKAGSDDFVFTPLAQNTNDKPARANTARSKNSRLQPSNNEPRKIRKPNFSGLDKAIQELDKSSS